ncbi:hypothetical protein [Mycobacterium kyogaense]|uniref:hypothetical protein n=1 Tax=Mycobacterium kyogaense TaxID=2212479 RepID=UPI0013C50770|nr:hypothetical protein [Mycobacterium kyogaense]
MTMGSVRAAGMSATAATLLFAPMVHAAPVGDPDSRRDAGLHHTVDATRAGDSHTTNPIPHTSDVLPLRAAAAKSDGPNHGQLVKLSTILERILNSDYDHDSDPHEKKRWQTASYQRVNQRSDPQNRETKVSALAAVSGSIAYMDGIFNVGPGWRTITMPDGSRCGAGCTEVTWNYVSSTGKTGSAAAAGAWMDAHNTPDAVLYTYSGSAVGAQDARALRPDWQGTIIQLGSPSRPNNGATYEQGGRPVPQVGGGTIEYVSTKSDEAAVRGTWYGNHTIGYRGRDFSEETPLSETHYGDNVTDRVYADPPIKPSWLSGLFTPQSSVEKVSDEGYVGRHRRDEKSTERRQVVKDMVDDVKRATSTNKRETKTVNKKPRLRDEGGASRESWSGSALRSGAVAPGVR